MTAPAATTPVARGDDRAPRLLRAGAALGAATVVASAANFAGNVALGRHLDAREFADAALVVSGLLLLSSLALGLQLWVARRVRIGVGATAVRRAQRRATGLGCLVAGAVAALSPWITSVFNMGSVTPVVVLALGVPIFFSMAVRRGILQAQERFSRLAMSQLAEPLARLGVTVAALGLGLGATSASVGLVAAFAAGWAISTPGPIAADGVHDAGQRTAATGTVLLLTGQVLIMNSDLWVVSALDTDNAGAYAAIALVGRLVFIAAWSIIVVVFPSLVSGSAAASRALMARALVATASIGGALAFAAHLLGDQVVAALLGAEYEGYGYLLAPYAIATTLFTLANLVAAADVAAGRAAQPALAVVGALLQIAILLGVAERGLGWVVAGQIVAMLALLAAMTTVSLMRAHTGARPDQDRSTSLGRRPADTALSDDVGPFPTGRRPATIDTNRPRQKVGTRSIRTEPEPLHSPASLRNAGCGTTC